MCRSRAKCYPDFDKNWALVANFSILQALHLTKNTRTIGLIT
ncbi:hypothetical protein [Aquimarina algicola]|nr:hypothetical protein [Aquimarina algicola]